jgi:xanthine/uracil/vitamin C permease (AzgA family)
MSTRRFSTPRRIATTARTEILAGATTWPSYIVVAFATCIAAAIGSAAPIGNLPLALTPGMRLNAYLTFLVVKDMGVPWQTALSVVFVSGFGFLLISAAVIREWLINAIPISRKVGSARQLGRRARFREAFLCATPRAGARRRGLGMAAVRSERGTRACSGCRFDSRSVG